MVSAGGSAARMSSSPSVWRPASTSARDAIEAACRTISSPSSRSVTGPPSAREKAPIRRSPSIRPCAARAVAPSRLATTPVATATVANTRIATTSPGRSIEKA